MFKAASPASTGTADAYLCSGCVSRAVGGLGTPRPAVGVGCRSLGGPRQLQVQVHGDSRFHRSPRPDSETHVSVPETRRLTRQREGGFRVLGGNRPRRRKCVSASHLLEQTAQRKALAAGIGLAETLRHPAPTSVVSQDTGCIYQPTGRGGDAGGSPYGRQWAAWGRAPRRQSAPRPRPAAGSRSAEFASPSLGVPAETRGHGPPHLCCLMALRRSTRCAKVKQKLTGEGSPHSVDEGRLGKAGGGPRNQFHGMRGHTRPPRHHSPLSPLLL